MPHKKQFYVPGLISLVGLPILFFFLGPEDPIYHTVIRLNLPSDKPRSGGHLSFNKVDFFHTIKNKKLISVDIDDYPYDERSEYERDRKLAFVSREIERLQFTGDTNTVFRLRFGNNNTYGQFIWAINMARVYDYRRYVYVDDDFYYLQNPPPQRMSAGEINFGIPISDQPYILPNLTPTSPSKWELFSQSFGLWWDGVVFDIRQSHWLVTGFLLFILVPGFIDGWNRTLKNA
ncbi:hypothetical protein ACX0G9_03185 [Flavitalea flava]